VVSSGQCDGTAVGWPYDVLLVVWQYGLAECLTDITRFCDSSHLDCDCNEESQFEGGHDGGEAIAIGPVMWIKVTKDHDAIFGAIWSVVFVFFDF